MKLFKPINLLIVDDSILIADAMKQLFKESNNINIIGICSDGSEVLSFVQQNKTDAIFMDIMMERMDGFKAIKEIKNYNSKIKIIGFSLINHTLFISKIKNMGADGFISKYDADKELMLKELYRVMSL